MICHSCNKNCNEKSMKHFIPNKLKPCKHGEQIKVNFYDKECLETFIDEKQCKICKGSGNKLVSVEGVNICGDNINYLHYSQGNRHNFNDESFIEYPNCMDVYIGRYMCNFCEKYKSLYETNPLIFHDIDKKNNTSVICYMCSTCYTEHEIDNCSISNYNKCKEFCSFPCIRISEANKDYKYLIMLLKIKKALNVLK
jgi:hypothetical protein